MHTSKYDLCIDINLYVNFDIVFTNCLNKIILTLLISNRVGIIGNTVINKLYQ